MASTRRSPLARRHLARRSAPHRGSGCGMGGCCAGSAVLLLVGLLLLLVGGAVAAVAAFDYFSRGLPDVRTLERTVLPETTRIYDREGKHLLATLYLEDREYVPLERIPRTLIEATIAIEDRNFWENDGVDPVAAVRAALNNANGEQVQGASTITQQLVKRLLVGREVTIDRKVREAILALRVTETYPKERILELYLNQIFYGNQAYGPAAAARRYFGRPLEELGVGQLALLAGIPQSPVTNDPFRNREAARARQAVVLAAMVREEYLTPAEAAEAAAAPWRLKRYTVDAPRVGAFTERAIEEAAAIMGGRDVVRACGCRIITTLDFDLQRLAQRIVRTFVEGRPDYERVGNAALVAQDPATGEILAYVGSANPGSRSPKVRGDFDSAGLALRSSGSSWKAITYLAAMEHGGLSPASTLWDVPTAYAPGYRPSNFSGESNGPTTIRQALRESLNVPAVRAMMANGGVRQMLDMARRLGVHQTYPKWMQGPAMAIGTGSVTLAEMTQVYSTINNLGQRVDQHRVLRIEDRDGNVIYAAAPQARQVVDPRLAYSMIDILRDNTNPDANYTFGEYGFIGRPAATKTGSEHSLKDIYTMGMIPQLTVGVWMGNADNSPMNGSVRSFSHTLQVWRKFTRAAIRAERYPKADWTRPEGMERATVCADRDKYGGMGFDTFEEGCPFARSSEWVIPGFNDPATRARAEGRRYGLLPTDGAGRLVSSGCASAVWVSGILAKAELPSWQDDLERWVARARAGGESRGGRFPWSSTRFILPGGTCG